MILAFLRKMKQVEEMDGELGFQLGMQFVYLNVVDGLATGRKACVPTEQVAYRRWQHINDQRAVPVT
jgi:hypothetical protein